MRGERAVSTCNKTPLRGTVEHGLVSMNPPSSSLFFSPKDEFDREVILL